MTKINKVFNKYFDLCETIYFNYILYFRFPLHNSTGEARPHLPPLIARPWSFFMKGKCDTQQKNDA